MTTGENGEVQGGGDVAPAEEAPREAPAAEILSPPDAAKFTPQQREEIWRAVKDIPGLLADYVSRQPYFNKDHPDHAQAAGDTTTKFRVETEAFHALDALDPYHGFTLPGYDVANRHELVGAAREDGIGPEALTPDEGLRRRHTEDDEGRVAELVESRVPRAPGQGGCLAGEATGLPRARVRSDGGRPRADRVRRSSTRARWTARSRSS